MNPSLRFASVLLLTLVSFSCTRLDDGMVRGRKAVSTLLDSVELVMDDNPSYADTIIQKIDSHSIKNKGQRARYALLYTATQYKNYRTISTDSIIMEAVNYYSVHNNLDYRFLSYYFLGCVYIDLGRLKDASVALAQAEQMVNKIDNDFWKGLLYCRLGYIYSESCNNYCAEDYYEKSVSFYEQSGHEFHKMYALCFLGDCKTDLCKYNEGDSILIEVQNWSISNNAESLLMNAILSRFSNFVITNRMDSATVLYNDYPTYFILDHIKDSFLPALLALYFNHTKEYDKVELCLNRTKLKNNNDSVYWYYFNSIISEDQGRIVEAFDYHKKYTSIHNKEIRDILMDPLLDAFKKYHFSIVEIESIKARNRKIILISSLSIFTLIVFILLYVSFRNRREAENQKRDYISTINNLTSQISVNQDKISNMNDKVREMLRQHFTLSDYLYTRFYEQIDDNKKAERLYRVVKSQLDGFTNSKNIAHIDELLNESFDGIMSKVLSSALEIKEKDLLILRFALAGFSAKSIAALLDDTHQNITQRKKRMLDKIQLKAPNLMEELRISLNIK